MEAVAFIFARGGSKGLPRKNIKLFSGKPLIAWSIAQAKAVSRIHRIIVSTDCQDIAGVALEYGAEVPFIRPPELALDTTPEWLAWKHALNFISKQSGKLPHCMVSLPPTAPLRQPEDIENCLDQFQQGNKDVVITTTTSHRNPYFNMVKKQEDGTVDLIIKDSLGVSRRQDAPSVLDVTTVAYVADPKFVLTHGSIFEGRVGNVHVPIERAVDIDSLLDFQYAEFIFSQKEHY